MSGTELLHLRLGLVVGYIGGFLSAIAFIWWPGL